ncbi:hypothetical protein B1812_18135 [Methylocystis bryophila]|uniref:Uncharacterized protein n=2 Tax=Methylocystis bryophila TaxID=655015 RepID=A0A1W6MYM4_9HYPH|nr:hypothetical protein B1812_18135 [Methylocystis bryophila]
MISGFASLAVSGCGFGLRVPEIQEAWDSPQDGDLLIREISKTVYLSIEKAVVCVMQDSGPLRDPKNRELFKKNWGVQATLVLTIQESSALAPGLTLNTQMHNGVVNFAGEYFGSSTASFGGPWAPFVSGYPSTSTFGPLQVPQAYSLGFGGKASSQATRIESSGAYFTVEKLLQNAKLENVRTGSRYEKEQAQCGEQTIDEAERDKLYPDEQENGRKPSKTAQFLSLIVNNDLKIYDWLASALHIQEVIAGMGGGTMDTGKGSGKSPAVGQNAITHEVAFFVVTEGSVTPSWRLVRVSANQNSPLFDTQRQRTHDLIVTFGPRDPKTGQLERAAQQQHDAALYGLANVNGIRGIFQP